MEPSNLASSQEPPQVIQTIICLSLHLWACWLGGSRNYLSPRSCVLICRCSIRRIPGTLEPLLGSVSP